MKIELSERMQAVSALVPKGHVAADIGCDHGFVSIDLVQRSICPHVYAADVRKGPLDRAKEHIASCGLKDKITAVLSEKKLFGAVLDVFESEPLSQDSPLWDMENVVITPHNSFVSEKNSERLFSVIYGNLSGFLKGDKAE